MRRYRDELFHAEMCSAPTTAAVINHSFSPPEKGVSWLEFCPNYVGFKTSDTGPARELTDAQREMIQRHEVAAIELAAKMQQGRT